jgi:putative glutathione S-transferase
MSNDEEKSKITSWASKDGSFKRQTSAFRDSIVKGGKFEPEKGKLLQQYGEKITG